MRSLALLGCLVAVLSLGACAFKFDNNAQTIDSALGGVPAREAFTHWKLKYDKTYTDDQEEERRYNVWLSNLDVVLKRNQEISHNKYRLGINGLADMTRDEFKARYISSKPLAVIPPREGGDLGKKPIPRQWRYADVKPKASMDWRKAGVIGPVRNQHNHNWSCGGCWAFATVGIAEIASAMYSGGVVPGSEQQLIDCDRKHDFGCDGGDFHNGLQYIIYNHGLNTEDNYPYVGHDQECDAKKEKEHKVKIDDYDAVPAWDEYAIMQAITMRPVVTAVCCGSNIDDWHHYTGGIFDIECCEDKLELDHAMVVLGYGEEDGEKYWILKNSWNTDWGEQGFMRMKRFVGEKSQCGMASMPTMVVRGPWAPSPKHGVVQAAVHEAGSAVRKFWSRVAERWSK